MVLVLRRGSVIWSRRDADDQILALACKSSPSGTIDSNLSACAVCSMYGVRSGIEILTELS